MGEEKKIDMSSLIVKLEDGTIIKGENIQPIEYDELMTFAEKIDLVRVVRCKDCKKTYDSEWNEDLGTQYCPTVDMCVTKDDYCSYGERRTDD